MAETFDLLERTPVIDTLEALDADLARKASKILGYHPMANHDNGIAQGTRLQAALRTLNIQPFSQASVRRYKASVTRTLLWWSHVVVTLGLAGLIGTAASRASMIEGTIICTVLTVGCLVWLFALLKAGGFGQWVIENLGETRQTVPSFALDTALRVHELVPNATFHIDAYYSTHELMKQRHARRVADPFLVVSHGSYTAYIEVWDEPGFEQLRKK